jgi:hypothetical protein
MRDANTARTLRRPHLTFQDLVSAAADVSEGEVGVIVQSMLQRGLIRFARMQPTFACVPKSRVLKVARRAAPRRLKGRSWS